MQHARGFAIVVLVVTGLFAASRARRAAAERANLSADALREASTHAVLGKVGAIYSRKSTEANWHYTRFVAEVQVHEVEKGDGVAANDLVYVRYWTRTWAGAGAMPPSASGHRGLPQEGDVVRIYLARNAYDGFSKDNNDGGFNVFGANGFEVPSRVAGD